MSRACTRMPVRTCVCRAGRFLSEGDSGSGTPEGSGEVVKFVLHGLLLKLPLIYGFSFLLRWLLTDISFRFLRWAQLAEVCVWVHAGTCKAADMPGCVLHVHRTCPVC